MIEPCTIIYAEAIGHAEAIPVKYAAWQPTPSSIAGSITSSRNENGPVCYHSNRQNQSFTPTYFPISPPFAMDTDREKQLQKAIKYTKDHPTLSKARIAAEYNVSAVTLRRRVAGTQTSRRKVHRD